jgi:hypothetical protein
MLASLTVLLTLFAWLVPPPQELAHDFLCYWTASKLLLGGENPYDLAAQQRMEPTVGAFFHPPWFLLPYLPFTLLPEPIARLAWLAAAFACLVLAGELLRPCVASPLSPVVIVPLGAFSIASVMLGQNVPLLLLGAAAVYRLVVDAWDIAAGIVLAWLTVKPQLSGLLILAIMVWSLRQRRLRLVGGFLGGLGALVAASFLIRPAWPAEMWLSLQTTPLPTKDSPWIGDSWLLLLRSCGLEGWSLWLPYLAVAIPAIGVVVCTAVRRDWEQAVGVSLLATFWVTPYNQFYDLAILGIPLCLLIIRLSPRQALWTVLAFVAGPHLHIALLPYTLLPWLPTYPYHKVLLFWVVAGMTAVWYAADRESTPRQPI